MPRASPAADTDQGVHRFRYAPVPGAGIADAVREGYRIDLPERRVTGGGADVPPLVSVAGGGVVVETVELADDGGGDVVVRLHEGHGGRTRAPVSAGCAVAPVAVTGPLERPVADIGPELELRPFQIVTPRLRRGRGGPGTGRVRWLTVTVRLPLFPLGSVLFPGLVLPLTVFEKRYRRLVADLAALPEDAPRRFGVVAIRHGSEVAPSGPPGSGGGEPGEDAADRLGPDPAAALYPVGCVAEVASIRTDEEDGRSELITSGTSRFRLLSVETGGPYLVGEAETLPEERGAGAGALAAAVARTFTTYQKRLAGAREQTLAAVQELPGDPNVLSYLVAAATILETGAKQGLLEAPDTAARLSAELRLLRREVAVLGKLPSLPATELTRTPPNPN